jgi:hypothetical protein
LLHGLSVDGGCDQVDSFFHFGSQALVGVDVLEQLDDVVVRNDHAGDLAGEVGELGELTGGEKLAQAVLHVLEDQLANLSASFIVRQMLS